MIKSFAKINIYLRILNKLDNGYHNLEMITLPIDLYDEIYIEKNNDLIIECLPKGPNQEKNIVFKAINYFKKITNIDPKFHVKINKNIPIGSGLGGASSNAGFVLKFLDNFFNTTVCDQKNYYDIALNVGADVPFFLNFKPAFVTGIGENIINIKIKHNLYFLLLIPNINISTKEMFEEYDKFFNNAPSNIVSNKYTLSDFFNCDYHIPLFHNDFENVLFKKISKLAFYKNILLEYKALASSISGTGSSLYGVFLDITDIEKTLIFLKNSIKDVSVKLVRVVH